MEDWHPAPVSFRVGMFPNEGILDLPGTRAYSKGAGGLVFLGFWI